MSNGCNHDCSSCSSSCGEKSSLLEKLNAKSSVKKVYAVVSGKGGVGKSLVTGLFASEAMKKNKICAVLDADITGPSVPKMFGIKTKASGTQEGIMPAVSKGGVRIMSSNMLLENDTDPVVWRGPMIAGMVKQFWTDVVWGDLDYMFIDMPPGTGDVPLTVFQSIKVDGIIVVTSPQELVSMIVEKALKMAEMMHIPVIGLVENFSYITCPCCDEKIKLFGESKTEEAAKKYNIKVLAKIPVESALAKKCDEGKIEEYDASFLSEALDNYIL